MATSISGLAVESSHALTFIIERTLLYMVAVEPPICENHV